MDDKIKQKEAELVKLKNKLTAQKDSPSGGDTQPEQSEHPPAEVVTIERKSKTEELITALQKASGKRLLICIKGYPDPDNIATSLALKFIVKHFDIDSTIVHFELISHQENRALVKKLDLDIEEYSDQFDYSSFDYYAINDSQTAELPIKLPETCELLVFVDHHKKLGTIKGEFVDIREDSGSTSAIYAEYLQDSRLMFKGETLEVSKIATALMHGIRTDTDNYVNATSLDFIASEFLIKHVDKDLLYLISRQSIPAKTMDLTQIALQRKDVRGTFMFSGVGYVRYEDRDGIGQCADYLLNREGIDTVVVYGVVGGEFIDGSLRTRSHTLDPDKWIKDVFGQDQHGVYYGGGRKDKGGFQIPLGVFSQCSDRELLWILIKKTIDELFYEKIGVDDSESIVTD
ncbi:MAG: bifunctional oligoribonuclease/PAP phosphatase NrnA [Oligoflexales bacterium]|nr:bifunctional oligoribonuclease/PAP phosphatase NrnA [Oligoflexales bacterium]